MKAVRAAFPLIVNKISWSNPVKGKKIETIALLLCGALEAGSKVRLKLNLPKTSAGGSHQGLAFAPQSSDFAAEFCGLDRRRNHHRRMYSVVNFESSSVPSEGHRP